MNEDTQAPPAEELPTDIEAIKAEIEATRAELTHTIDAIQDKVDPRKVAHRVGDQALDKMHEASEKVAETAKSASQALSDKVQDVAPDAAKSIRDKGAKLAGKIRSNPRYLAYASAALGTVFVLVGIGRSRK